MNYHSINYFVYEIHFFVTTKEFLGGGDGG